MSVEMAPSIINKFELAGIIWHIRIKGANFCQVERISPVVKSSPWSTSGSQKCMGASPILRARAKVSVMAGKACKLKLMSHCPVIHAFVVLANRIRAAAPAWIIKYFVVASTARGWWCWVISGIIARVLISSPIQAISQWELAKVRVVPRPKLNKRMERIKGFISKGRNLTNMFGVWAQELNLADLTRKWCSWRH